MNRRGAGSLLLVAIGFILFGIFIFFLGKIIAVISLVVGVVLAVVSIINFFSGSRDRAEY